MDPLSQAVVGGVAGQNVTRWQHIRIAGVLAFLAGMAADLDVLINSDTDQLLALQYHRQFTHSLIFIPIGGLLVASLLYWLFARKFLSFKYTAIYCIAGYATHALLDACTSYGTQLLWPFSNMRIAWNCISIIDPLFTLPLLLLIVLAHISNKIRYARWALVFAAFYLSLGVMQNHRVVDAGRELALSRGHEPNKLQAKASLGNMVLWKVIYEYNDRFYVDAVRAISGIQIIEGESVARLDVKRDFPWLDLSSQQARDIDRFAWFSDDFLSVDRRDKNIIVDMRYSMLPNSANALWGIRLSPTAGAKDHVVFVNLRDAIDEQPPRFSALWKMLLNTN